MPLKTNLLQRFKPPEFLFTHGRNTRSPPDALLLGFIFFIFTFRFYELVAVTHSKKRLFLFCFSPPKKICLKKAYRNKMAFIFSQNICFSLQFCCVVTRAQQNRTAFCLQYTFRQTKTEKMMKYFLELLSTWQNCFKNFFGFRQKSFLAL